MKKPNKEEIAAWYKKLKDSGFNDIEQDEFRLRQWDSSAARRSLINQTHESWKAKQEYYIVAYQFLHSYSFPTDRERIIWEYHSNGISMRNIAKLLKQVKIKTNKDEVNKTIKQLRIIMLQTYAVVING